MIKSIVKFKEYLINEEKSEKTLEKYIRDVTAFYLWANSREITKELVVEYKNQILKNYAPRSVNSMLSSLNSFFAFLGRHDLKIKILKIQTRIFANQNKELTKAEYERLLKVAKNKNDERLYLLMQTICSAGLRVSEIKYVTVEAVKSGLATIDCKGKIRQVFLPKALCQMLKAYIRERKIKSGSVFVTRTGKPLDRSNIWKMMSALCEAAKVSKEKVFPHNLRHLFARTFYKVKKDIVRLADILGHSSVNTTRIYTMESGAEHRRSIQKLGLLMC